jgi:hypothetical protein
MSSVNWHISLIPAMSRICPSISLRSILCFWAFNKILDIDLTL